MAILPPPVRRLSAVAAATALVIGSIFAGGAAIADSAPAVPSSPATPATVSADVLPTPQIDGVVWTQRVVGSTVYAGGNFQTARPFGAAPGVNTVSRPYLLSYNLVTGLLNTRFVPSLNGQVKSILASADGKHIYVAGTFTRASNASHVRVVELDATTGAAVAAFKPVPNSTVNALTLRAGTLFLGGSFSIVNGKARSGLASVNASTGSLLPWAPMATGGSVQALTISPDTKKIIAGGTFTKVSNSSNPGYGIAALDPVTGKMLPWAMNSKVRDAGNNSGITSLTSDPTGLYGSGFVYGSGGNLEGTFRADWATGAIVWVEDCHGDTYSTAVTASVEYVAGHAHFCGNIGGFPQSTNHRGIAFSKNATQKIATNSQPMYANWAGTPAPSLLNWYPDFDSGSFTGQSQGPWSVAATSQYVVYGGEFTTINGIKQQGLTRFAISSIAPNKMGPMESGADFDPSAVSLTQGTVRLAWIANQDLDNGTLTYQLYRDGNMQTPIFTTKADSSIWNRPEMGFTDTGLTPGQTYSYRLRATDPFGNTVLSDGVNVTVRSDDEPPYPATVILQNASAFWRFGGPTGALVDDLAGYRDLISGSGVSPAAGGSSTDGSVGSTFSGTGAGLAATQHTTNAPSVFSEEAWFKTTVAGGEIVGFGKANTGVSSQYDRQLYLSADGRLNFGVYTGTRTAVTSPKGLNDGAWHQAVGTFDGKTSALYVDGVLVASRSDLRASPVYSGYWRVGGDTTWSGSPWFAGSIDDVSIYPMVLSASQVAAQFSAATTPIVSSTPTPTPTPTPEPSPTATSAPSASTPADR